MKAEIAYASSGEIESLLLEQGAENWSMYEDTVAQRAWLTGIFYSENDARRAWDELYLHLPRMPTAKPDIRRLNDCDWRHSYKAHFKAWHFGPLHWVPVWERESFDVPEGHKVLWLDPGMAFGTGNHETTRLCVEQLVTLAEGRGPDGYVVDAGCGSGILALSAVLLGFQNVTGFDIDPEAVRVSQENAAFNSLGGRAEFFTGDLATGLISRKAMVLLANIQADLLMRFARELVAATAPGGMLILGGILASELETVRAKFTVAAPGWVSDTRVLGEWSNLTLARPPS